jgi:hypothetical protein
MQLILCVLILLEGLYECWTRVMEQTSMGKAVSRFFHEEIAFPQQVVARAGKSEELQTFCLSEKGRYVTLIGRIKENATNLRRYHAAMAPEWDDVTSGDSDYITAISGDLKYLLTMGGSVGASGSFPCSHCVRSRKSMCYRGWIPAEVETMRHLEPKSFHGDSQLRSHPVDEKCEHDVDAGTCFCIDKGAEYIQEYVDTVHEQDCEDFQVTDQHAPFHAAVIKLTRDNTYSIVAPPLLKHVPLALIFPGIWHCCHNTRQMLWIMIKDAAAVYGVDCSCVGSRSCFLPLRFLGCAAGESCFGGACFMSS